MKIAIFDIDETITLETDFMKKYAEKYGFKRHGWNCQADYKGNAEKK